MKNKTTSDTQYRRVSESAHRSESAENQNGGLAGPLILVHVLFFFAGGLLTILLASLNEFMDSKMEIQPFELKGENPIDLGLILTLIPLLAGLLLFLDTPRVVHVFTPGHRSKIRTAVVAVLYFTLLLGLVGELIENTRSSAPVLAWTESELLMLPPVLTGLQPFISSLVVYGRAASYELFIYCVAVAALLTLSIILYRWKSESKQEKEEIQVVVNGQLASVDEKVASYFTGPKRMKLFLYAILWHEETSGIKGRPLVYLVLLLAQMAVTTVGCTGIVLIFAWATDGRMVTGMVLPAALLTSATLASIEYLTFSRRRDWFLVMSVGGALISLWIVLAGYAVSFSQIQWELIICLVAVFSAWGVTTFWLFPPEVKNLTPEYVRNTLGLNPARHPPELSVEQIRGNFSSLFSGKPLARWCWFVLKNPRGRRMLENAYLDLLRHRSNLRRRLEQSESVIISQGDHGS